MPTTVRTSAGQSVQVPKDHGTRVAKGQLPEKPRLLPEPPVWTGGTRSVRLLGAQVGFGTNRGKMKAAE